jgi:hypothetical protein
LRELPTGAQDGTRLQPGAVRIERLLPSSAWCVTQHTVLTGTDCCPDRVDDVPGPQGINSVRGAGPLYKPPTPLPNHFDGGISGQPMASRHGIGGRSRKHASSWENRGFRYVGEFGYRTTDELDQ